MLMDRSKQMVLISCNCFSLKGTRGFHILLESVRMWWKDIFFKNIRDTNFFYSSYFAQGYKIPSHTFFHLNTHHNMLQQVVTSATTMPQHRPLACYSSYPANGTVFGSKRVQGLGDDTRSEMTHWLFRFRYDFTRPYFPSTLMGNVDLRERNSLDRDIAAEDVSNKYSPFTCRKIR